MQTRGERICKVLQVALSTYYAASGRPASSRALRDAEIAPQLLKLWEGNYCVYEVRRLWKSALCAGIEIGRDQTVRLWVTDLTFVPTRQGVAHVCFIVDAFSRTIVGWRVASNTRTETVFDAIEVAAGRGAAGIRSCGAIRTRGRNSRRSAIGNASPRSWIISRRSSLTVSFQFLVLLPN